MPRDHTPSPHSFKKSHHNRIPHLIEHAKPPTLSNPIFPKRQFQEPNHDPFQHQNPEPQVLSNPICFPADTSAQQQAKA